MLEIQLALVALLDQDHAMALGHIRQQQQVDPLVSPRARRKLGGSHNRLSRKPHSL
jgi:hypothetical protein